MARHAGGNIIAIDTIVPSFRGRLEIKLNDACSGRTQVLNCCMGSSLSSTRRQGSTASPARALSYGGNGTIIESAASVCR
jgi:hypothetical protein